uniref:Sec20 C-terminal domain-containing protein n=1 Tax=Paramoeba aestuarina TaxID=180227 RepID=A0A7S4KEE7_9EUKA
MNGDGAENSEKGPTSTPPDTSYQTILRTQREVRRLNTETMAIVDALRSQRSSLDKTDTIKQFMGRIGLSSVLIKDSERGHLRNRVTVYVGIFVWLALIVYILWRRM